MSGYIQTNQVITLSLAVDYNVSAADTGKIFSITSTVTPIVINLPVLQAGLHYRFVLSALPAGLISVTSPNATSVYGVLINTTINTINTIIKTGTTNTARFNGTAAAGDYMDIYCDGSKWHYAGISSAQAGFAA